MTDKAKALMALAKLEARASAVAAEAMQARVALAVADVVPRYSDRLRLVADAERSVVLAGEVDAALSALDGEP